MGALQMADEQMQHMADQRYGSLIVEFYLYPIQDEAKSAAAGRPIYEEQEFVRIRVPGDKDEIRERAVRAKDRVMYAQQYAAFKNKLEQPTIGTPLEQIPFLNKAQVLEFRALGMKTAEHVRDMPDAHAQKFMGSASLRKRLTDFLAAAAGAAPIEKLNAETASLRSENEALKKMLEEQGARIDALTKQSRK